MALPTAFPSDWHPCKGCACLNHAIPSYKFSVTDADSPIADHPDLEKLTRSNDAPTPPEEKTLRGMISDSGKRIDTIDVHVLELKVMKQELLQSITHVDKELAKLDKERQRLSDRVRERRPLLNALRRMPKELLAHIFLHTLNVFPLPGIQPSETLFSAIRHPLLSFELVSRKWKDVLDIFPNLWSYVNILIDRTPSSAYVCFIGNQLSRSRQSPLSVSISRSDSFSFHSLDTFPTSILMTLFTVSHRIQTLHLCLPDEDFADMQQFHLSFPNLQELLLSSSETSEVAQHLNFGSLPSLRVFHATDVGNIDELSLPWHQMTHFTSMDEAGRGLTARHALDALKTMSRVSVCRLSVCHFSLELQPLTTGVTEPTTLSKLRSLTLSSSTNRDLIGGGFDFPPVIPSVLNSLVLPTLLDLSVTTSLDQAETFTSIRQLVERSCCPLTSLYFSNGDIENNDLIYILSNTPTLQDLRLTNMEDVITDELLNDLSCKIDTQPNFQVPVLVPHLHTLHLSGYFGFQVKVYVQMVESRWMCHPRHLKSVDICRFMGRRREREEEAADILALSRLDVLVSEGLDATVSMQRI